MPDIDEKNDRFFSSIS